MSILFRVQGPRSLSPSALLGSSHIISLVPFPCLSLELSSLKLHKAPLSNNTLSSTVELLAFLESEQLFQKMHSDG